MRVLLISALHCLKRSGKFIYSNETTGNGDATNPYVGQAVFAVDFEGWSDKFIYFIYLFIFGFSLSDFAHKSKRCKYFHIAPFQSPSRTRPNHLSFLRNGYLVCSSQVRRSGRGVDHPFQFSVEVKERVELYLSSPSGPSWPILGPTSHFRFA